MTETDLQSKYAKKIAALLAKAESTTPEEAELLTEKAQQLMAQYAIEQALVDEALGNERREEIVRKTVEYKSSYHHGLFELGSAIGTANDCRVLLVRDKNYTKLVLIGFESDVDRAIMLDASLQIQMQVALRAAARRGEVRSEHWMTAMDKFKERREFMFGFATGVARRLDRAKLAGREDYLERVVAAGADRDETSSGMELVVRSRRDRVDDWVDQKYGEIRTIRGGVSAGGSYGAHDAGHRAGLNADTGSAGRVGQRRALTR